MKTDYKQEVKNVIENYYEPVFSVIEATKTTEKKSLKEVYTEVTDIIPARWIDEGDVYEALTELGFKYFHTFIEEEIDVITGEVVSPSRNGLLYFMNKKTATI